MREYFVVGSVILALALLAPGALAQGEGVIEAQVVNGTRSGDPVEGLTVTLRAFQGMTDELVPQTAVADAEGRVRFEGVDISPDITYVLSAIYADVDYDSLSLNFEEGGETTLTASVEVFETTENPDEAAIQVELMHVFVEFRDGAMSVGELHIFSSTGDRTFVGVQEPELGQRITLRFALPEGATDLRFEAMGEEGGRYLLTRDGFADTGVVRPGTSQRVLFGYTLNYGQADAFDFAKLLLYPTANLNVLVPRLGLDVTSDQVELSEIRTLEGQVYLNLSGTDFAAGDELSVHFAGLEDVVRQPASTAATRSGFDPKWIALGLAALALVGAVIYPALRRSGTPVLASESVESADAHLTCLLQAIADLDDALEAGRMDESSYRQQRQALKSEALALMQES